MSLNTSDEGYNNGKKYGQKGTICGPNTYVLSNKLNNSQNGGPSENFRFQ
jgi:hypothetical protein